MRRFAVSHGAMATALLLAVLLLLASPLYAQLTGTVSGTVYDQSGAVIPKAKITLINQASKDVRQSTSNEVGYFTFAGVLPSTYTLKVEAAGFKSWQRGDIAINPSDARNIADIALQVGKTDELITVEAVAGEVRPVDSGEHASVLTNKQIDMLALTSRNATELLKVLPGVTSVAQGGGNGNALGFDFGNAGASGSPVGVGLSTNGVPYRGGSALLQDGANIIDAGNSGWSISAINPDMTQEVKVQSSAFGADSARGPVVINIISKSGTANWHGEGYLNFRHNALNSNSWQNNHSGSPKPADKYYYPGGNIGGPVPGFHKKLLVWGGYEYMWQDTAGSTTLTSYIPSASMQAGNFDMTRPDNAALCPGGAATTGSTWCRALAGSRDTTGALITGTTVPVDPGAAALMSLWPAPNMSDVSSTNGCNGCNWRTQVAGMHNGYIYRTRVDYNINDNNKIYVSYQYGHDTQPSSGNAHVWWVPGNSITFPGGGMTAITTTKTLTGNFLHVFSPSLTNEFTAAWSYANEPQGPNNISAVYRTTTNYPTTYGKVYSGGGNPSLMVPSWTSPGQQTFPEMSQGDAFTQNGSAFQLIKANPSFADNLTKVHKTHTLKFGFYTELTGNNQGSGNPYTNGVFNGWTNGVRADAVTGNLEGSDNPTASFVMGVANNYQENNVLVVNDVAYRTLGFYGKDSWKVTKRLTVEAGLRLDHFGHWYDRRGNGTLVWLPDRISQDINPTTGDPLKIFPGTSWRGIDPGIPNGGEPNRLLFSSPRFGMAWDLFGNGKTVLRGGWGRYRFNDQAGDTGGAESSAQNLQTYNLPGSTNIAFRNVGLLHATGVWSASGVTVVDPKDYEVGVTNSYNFTISQQLPWQSLLEVAYVGNSSDKLMSGGQVGGGGSLVGGDFVNVNKMPLGALYNADPITGVISPNRENIGTVPGTGAHVTCVSGDPGCLAPGYTNSEQDYRPYGIVMVNNAPLIVNGAPVSLYGTNAINLVRHVAYANYNALQMVWTKQAGRINFNLNYTWSKALGMGNNNQNPYSLRGNYGVLNIDRAHVINASYQFSLGNLTHSNKILGGATNGWTISGITTWQSGGNQQALTTSNLGMSLQYSGTLPTGVSSGIGSSTYYGTTAQMTIQPTISCNPRSGLSGHQDLNFSCFGVPTLGTNGPRNYPYLTGPAYFNSDLAVFKTFHITEKQTFEFRLSAFNFLNHPLWALSDNARITPRYETPFASVGTVGTFTARSDNVSPWGTYDTKLGRRILSMGFKYTF